MDRFLDWVDRQSQKKVDLPCTILGQRATTAEEANAILETFALWTYRCDFRDALPNSRLVSDKNWGCLIRTSQMLLSRVLHLHGAYKPEDFRDTPEARFSIHKMVSAVVDPHSDFKPEFWAPSQGCEALRVVVANANLGFTVNIVNQACIYNDEVLFALKRMPVLLLLPCRPTASERITQNIFQVMEHLLASPHCVGIVGGVPRRSYYFIGSTSESQRLIFLDPHVKTQPAYLDSKTEGYLHESADTIGCVDWPRIDSSLLIGVFLRSAKEFMDFTEHLKVLLNIDRDSVFVSVEPSRTTNGLTDGCGGGRRRAATIDEVETF
jgi:cysteine protease ATG4